MSLINFITKTVFYVTAILTPIIFFKAVSNPTALINLNDNILLICTLGSIESIPLMEGSVNLFNPHQQTIETILTLSSINVPELISASDIQIMSKISSLDKFDLKNFSNLVKLPKERPIGINTRDFFINILTTEQDTAVLSKIKGSAARINALLDYYLISRSDTLNGLNPNKNFLQMLELHIKNPKQIDDILLKTLNHSNVDTSPHIFKAAINNNIEPFPGYNELESIKNIDIKLREEIVNNNKFSPELQQAAKDNYESINDNLKKSKNNM